MTRITSVKPMKNYQIHLEFADGLTGIVDLSEYAGKGVFSIWNDYRVFKNVEIGSSGELIWGDAADLCPDTLYMKLKKIGPKDLFPNLRKEPVRA
jgi:hypothetical protein